MLDLLAASSLCSATHLPILTMALPAPCYACRDELWFFIDEDYDSYVQRMRQPQCWGGETPGIRGFYVLARWGRGQL